MIFSFIVILLCIFIRFTDAEETLRLATTTSTYETGLLDYILPVFEKEFGCEIHVISVGTGKALRLGENGDVDILLVHAPEAEKRFMKDEYGTDRRYVMHNDFVILGPEDDPAGIGELKKSTEAFKKIYASENIFVSRGDDSGTDKKEKSLWARAGLYPRGAWYLETGQGMNATLRVADEKRAYVMLDRATYLFNKDKVRLKILVEGDRDLLNPYGVIAVNPLKHPHVNHRLSLALVEWMTSSQCREMINKYEVNGDRLFYADDNSPVD
ncbi:MAG: substrate-binding domain-containing protein [Candidatus Omnitrophica bacterium]|nr:substrate-binding domain-containing protein [Candidatus Omnitrophota bacterium]